VLKKEPQKERRKKRGPADVNELVDLTNQLRSDYRRLGQFLGGGKRGAELSIEQLSKLNDSLLTGEGCRDLGSD
jgi:hypothetical protein